MAIDSNPLFRSVSHDVSMHQSNDLMRQFSNYGNFNHVNTYEPPKKTFIHQQDSSESLEEMNAKSENTKNSTYNNALATPQLSSSLFRTRTAPPAPRIYYEVDFYGLEPVYRLASLKVPGDENEENNDDSNNSADFLKCDDVERDENIDAVFAPPSRRLSAVDGAVFEDIESVLVQELESAEDFCAKSEAVLIDPSLTAARSEKTEKKQSRPMMSDTNAESYLRRNIPESIQKSVETSIKQARRAKSVVLTTNTNAAGVKKRPRRSSVPSSVHLRNQFVKQQPKYVVNGNISKKSNNNQGNTSKITIKTYRQKSTLESIVDDISGEGDFKFARALGRTAAVNAMITLGGPAAGYATGAGITGKRLSEGVANEDDKEVTKSLAVYGAATTASTVGQAVAGGLALGVFGATLPVAGVIAFATGCASGITMGALSEMGVDAFFENDESKNDELRKIKMKERNERRKRREREVAEYNGTNGSAIGNDTPSGSSIGTGYSNSVNKGLPAAKGILKTAAESGKKKVRKAETGYY